MAKVKVNWGRLPSDCDVKLYSVHNTARNVLYVLARNQSIAMSIAHAANHVYGTTTILALDYGRWVEEVKRPPNAALEEHWDALQAAIAQRLQGTVHFERECLRIGTEVIPS